MIKNKCVTAVMEAPNKTGGLSLELFCKVLKAAIDDYGFRNRTEANPFFDPFGELALMMNKSTSTIRKWTNPWANDLPKVNDLLVLCRLIGDRRPFDVFQSEFERLVGDGK